MVQSQTYWHGAAPTEIPGEQPDPGPHPDPDPSPDPDLDPGPDPVLDLNPGPGPDPDPDQDLDPDPDPDLDPDERVTRDPPAVHPREAGAPRHTARAILATPARIRPGDRWAYPRTSRTSCAARVRADPP